MNYRKKPVVIEASQWYRHGDHAKVRPYPFLSECACMTCGHPYVQCGEETHGRIDTLEGIMTVCPGDWIITGVNGEHYPCKPDIFAKTYELAE
jgi:hypothetical protein